MHKDYLIGKVNTGVGDRFYFKRPQRKIDTFKTIEAMLFSAVNYVKEEGCIIHPAFAEAIKNRPADSISEKEIDLTTCIIEGANNIFYREEWYAKDRSNIFFFNRDGDWRYKFERYGFMQETTSILAVMYAVIDDAKAERYPIESIFDPANKFRKEQKLMLECLAKGINHLKCDKNPNSFKPRIWASKDSNTKKIAPYDSTIIKRSKT